jgi:hypothetical protein
MIEVQEDGEHELVEKEDEGERDIGEKDAGDDLVKNLRVWKLKVD